MVAPYESKFYKDVMDGKITEAYGWKISKNTIINVPMRKQKEYEDELTARQVFFELAGNGVSMTDPEEWWFND